ncbi:MAG: UDP-N-acetylglucosamine 2-epimerase [Candidatus Methanoculleus thermohydrogenotrophicum]
MPAPDDPLDIGSGSHGVQTGRMLAAVEDVIGKEEPGIVLVYGDTNSTLAGALAAAKVHVPVAHIEAGLRMPGEVNRVLTDPISALLFCPTATAVANLAAEGVTAGVHLTGDVMVDALRENLSLAKERSTDPGLSPKGYCHGPRCGEHRRSPAASRHHGGVFPPRRTGGLPGPSRDQKEP